MRALDTRVLDFHAGYQCRNSGVCCSSGWPIGVEPDRLEVIESALASSALRPAIAGAPAFVRPDPPGGFVILGSAGGRCVFHGVGRCEIHTALGHAALPLACRQFPRTCVRDPRGTSITLSHHCPTAAAMIDSALSARSAPHRPGTNASTIVVNAPGFPADGEYVGLDASDALPPLLRPSLLMDWDSWWRVEDLAVRTLLQSGASAHDALARLRSAVLRILPWDPTAGSLRDRVEAAFASPDPVAGGCERDALAALTFDAVPDAYRPRARDFQPAPTDDLAHRRFLASHAFANWPIHLGGDLLTWLVSIETANALVDAGLGIRHADLVLRHLIDVGTWTAKLRAIQRS